MKKTIMTLLLAGAGCLADEAAEAEKLFRLHCTLCHTTRNVSSAEKSRLLGPPVDEVMYHVKEKYPIREDAVKFMADYILEPKVEKALCASMDKFGLMPSMKSSVTPKEAKEIASMMFDVFPRPEFSRQEKKSREGITFAAIDTDGDGFVSPGEFRDFRAKRNGIDPKEFKADLYFRKIDLDGDGKMSPKEFETMRRQKMKKR